MSVRPAGVPQIAIDGEDAERAVVLSALNAAYDREAGYAKLNMIHSALQARGEGHLIPKLPSHLARMMVQNKVRPVGGSYLRWQPM